MTEIQRIINGNKAKSQKMRDLFELGFSRTEVANMLGAGYGFVQNVYQKHYKTGRFAIDTDFLFRFNRTFGIEIEAYNCNRNELARLLNDKGVNTNTEGYNHSTRGYWKIIGDGSVMGNDSFEIVSPVLTGEEGIRELQTVCDALEELGAKVNKSCGVHVHIGVADYGIKDWRRLFKNYIKMENTIDSFMPTSRRGNNNMYCKSMKKRNVLNKISAANNLRDLESAILQGSRYHKLNTKSFWRQETVEFRQHSGTTSFDKISNWVRFVMRLTEYSKTTEISRNGFDGMQEFCTEEITNFYKQRKQQLAA